MKRIQIAAAIGFVALCAGCTPKPDATAVSATNPDASKKPDQSSTDYTKPVTNKVDTAAPVPPVIPAALETEGYRYYGLTRTEPMNYLVTVSNENGEQAPVPAGQSIQFEGMDAGKAKFVIRRTGALEPTGSMHVLVDPKGITITSTSAGTLDGTQLDLPADVSPGATWSADYKIDFSKSTAMPTGGKSTVHYKAKVVGSQKVTTKAGTFDALLVESDEEDMLGGKPTTLHAQDWYVKDRGLVKMIVDSKQPNNVTAKMTIEEAPDTDSK